VTVESPTLTFELIQKWTDLTQEYLDVVQPMAFAQTYLRFSAIVENDVNAKHEVSKVSVMATYFHSEISLRLKFLWGH